MKSLIILRGLVKSDKKNWVKSQGLETFFLDYDYHTMLYSTPELILKSNTDKHDYLGRIKTKSAYESFLSAVNSRMESGCLVVLDIGMEKSTIYKTLAKIYGYTVFYKVFPIPQDYIGNPKKYSNPLYKTKTRDELLEEVNRFLNQQFEESTSIDTYEDLEKYWKNHYKYQTIDIDSKEDLFVFSDIHGNYDLLMSTLTLHNIPITSYKVFLGDYIDGEKIPGGSRKMIEFIFSHGGYSTFIEGNHERRLRKYLYYLSTRGSSGEKNETLRNIIYNSLPKDWLSTVGKEFDPLTDKEAGEWLGKLNSDLVLFKVIRYNGNKFIFSHGGLRCLDQISPKYIGNLLYGNRDIDQYDREFSRGVWPNTGIWSIHGHCKYPGENPQILKYDGVMNLDPQIERDVDAPEIIYINLKNNKPCIVR